MYVYVYNVCTRDEWWDKQQLFIVCVCVCVCVCAKQHCSYTPKTLSELTPMHGQIPAGSCGNITLLHSSIECG